MKQYFIIRNSCIYGTLSFDKTVNRTGISDPYCMFASTTITDHDEGNDTANSLRGSYASAASARRVPTVLGSLVPPSLARSLSENSKLNFTALPSFARSFRFLQALNCGKVARAECPVSHKNAAAAEGEERESDFGGKASRYMHMRFPSMS